MMIGERNDSRALVEILRAWQVPGSHPHIHRVAKAELRLSWPALAQALDAASESRRVR